MQLSINILLDALEKHHPQNYILDKNKGFSSVGLVSKNVQGLYSDQIYVCTLSVYKKILQRDNTVCLIIVKNSKEEIPRSLALDNTIVVNFDGGLIDFFSFVQSIFATVFNWCSKMDEYLIKKRSIQEILSLSESVIGNFITISDSSFALVAYTEGLECDDPLTARLVENGYHDQDAIDKFNRYKLPAAWRDTVDIYQNDSNNICIYPIIAKIVHYYNNYYSHIVMICNNKRPTEGLKDLFKLLVDHLMVCFERQWLDNNQMPHVHDSLLISLTGPTSLTEEAARNRARNSGLPFNSNFRFARITTEDSSNIMLQRIEREIMAYVPESKLTLHQQGLMALIIQQPKSKDKFDQIMEALLPILTRYNASCGISDRFDVLTDVKIANEQAKVALSCSSTGKVVQYNDCYPKYLLASDPQNAILIQSSKSYKSLMLIDGYDKKHGTNNFELLYEYLKFDRKATETAQTMHMHRNNVIYRIGRICEQINIDLDNPDERFRLLLAYEVYPHKSKDHTMHM